MLRQTYGMGKEMIHLISTISSIVFSYGITISGINEEAQLFIIIPVCGAFGAIGSLLTISFNK